MKCPECSSPLKNNKRSCACGWRQEKTKRNPTTPCNHCGEISQTSELKNCGAVEVCADCLLILREPPETRAYFKEMERLTGVGASGMAGHLAAANSKNMKLIDYLRTLPRSREQYLAYFKGTKGENMFIPQSNLARRRA